LPPLEYGTNEKSFKPIFLDIGLMNHLLKLRLINVEALITVNEGSLAEQFIGQQLLSAPPYFRDKQLYYWNREQRNAEAELDYLLESKNIILPIEVKAGKSGKLKSLHLFMSIKQTKTAIRFNTEQPSMVDIDTKVNLKKQAVPVSYKLINLPLYLCNLIWQEKNVFDKF